MVKKISLTFDLRYLKNFSKASTLSDQMTIKLSSNLTAVFEYKIAEMGYFRYHMMSAHLAPPPLCRRPPVMPPPTILELRMETATFLKNVLEVLSLDDLFSEANVNFSSTGLELQATDTIGFALVVLQLCPKAFNSYICNKDGCSVGLIVADMAKASSFANNDDNITIEAQEGVQAIDVTFKSPGKFGTRTSFVLAALCPDPVLILGLWK
jgi:DNA polymerase III sliding clamp (beta) subunit (PCNA family)